MKQRTLWELDETTDALANAIWAQLDPAVKAQVLERLSVLMVKAVRPQHAPLPTEKESDHE